MVGGEKSKGGRGGDWLAKRKKDTKSKAQDAGEDDDETGMVSAEPIRAAEPSAKVVQKRREKWDRQQPQREKR